MSDELDDALRAALRPVDPGEKFTQSVLARVADESTRRGRVPWGYAAALRWASAALVVSLVAVILVTHERQARRTQRGLEARRELFQALQLTSEKLDVAYRVVNDEEHSKSGNDSGV
jgi:hypothetical protein